MSNRCDQCGGPTGKASLCFGCSGGKHTEPQGKAGFIDLMRSDPEAAAAVKSAVAIFNAKLGAFGPDDSDGLVLDWPAEILLADKDGPIGTAKLRKLPAAKDAKCSVNGAKDAERVYTALIGEGKDAYKLSYRLCLTHAAEWAALQQEK